MTEAFMLRRLQKGCEDGLGWFIDRYNGYVCAIIQNIIGSSMSRSDVEEVASDVFLALWQNAGSIQSGHVQGYLAAVSRNKAKNKLRELGKTVPLEDHTISLDIPDPENELQRKMLSAAVREAVMALPDRELFLRFYFYYQTVEQISRELGINPSTVKTKLRRGREALKRALSDFAYDIRRS